MFAGKHVIFTGEDPLRTVLTTIATGNSRFALGVN